MLKRIILLIGLLLTGMISLYFRPMHIDQDPAALISSQSIRNDFAQHKNFDSQNQIAIVLTDTGTDIFNPVFLKTLKDLTDNVFYLSGVDRAHIMSLFSNTTQFTDIVADGFEGGPLIPEDFSYSPADYEQIKNNLLKSPYLGKLVSYDFKSAVISVPFFDIKNGRQLTKGIQHLLPQNSSIHFSILGYAPYVLEINHAFKHSVFVLLISWLISAILFCFFMRTFTPLFSLILGPLSTVTLVCFLGSLSGISFHFAILPDLILILILSFLNMILISFNSDKTPCLTPLLYSVLPAISLLCLNSPLGGQMVFLALAATLSLLLAQQFFFKMHPPLTLTIQPAIIIPKPFLPITVQNLLLTLLLIIGLCLSAKIVIHHSDLSSLLLRNNTIYLKNQELAQDKFSFSANSISILAITNKSYTDPATVSALEKFHWFLTHLPSVKSVWSLADAVKTVNVLFYENNIKWKSIPREQQTLIATTSVIDPTSGLLDNTGKIMPVTVFLEKYTPQTLNIIYESIKNFRFPSDLLSLKMVGGTAGLEAIYNQTLTKSIKQVLLVFFIIVLFITLRLSSFSKTMNIYFVFLVILSLTLGLITVAQINLSLSTLSALIFSSSLSLYILWNLQNNSTYQRELLLGLLLSCVMIAGGLFSQLSLIFQTTVIAESMWLLTYLIGFHFLSSKEVC